MSLIQWTDETWNALRARFTNPITGEVRIGWHCEHCSSGCINCYAENQKATKFKFYKIGTSLQYTRPNRDN